MKACNPKIAKSMQICNPMTGRWIVKGGGTHLTLVSKGQLDMNGNPLIGKQRGETKRSVSIPAPIPVIDDSSAVYKVESKYMAGLNLAGQTELGKLANNHVCSAANKAYGNGYASFIYDGIGCVKIDSPEGTKIINGLKALYSTFMAVPIPMPVPIIVPTKAKGKSKAEGKTAKPKGERKAPKASAGLYEVGTELAGTDGIYIVALRKNDSKYWMKCSFKNSNCKTGQSGGMPFVAALPLLSELAVPVGLGAAAYWSKTRLEKKTQ